MLIEAVCQSVEDCLLAEKAGAHRIEFCAALALGGLTPNPIAVGAATARVKIPIAVMVRPREGGFVYSADEKELLVLEAGFWSNVSQDGQIEGVVVGALNDDATLDTATLAKVANQNAGGSLVIHRCIDSTPDLFAAMESVIDLGFTRILTSGGANSALEGAETLKRMIEIADGRIDILAAGGIRSSNLAEVAAKSAVSQAHLGPVVPVSDGLMLKPDYGSHRILDVSELEKVVAVARTLG